MTRLVKEKVSPNRSLRAWEIALLILGFPLWFPLLIAALAVCFSYYITIWSLIIALWSVFIAFVASFLSGITAAGMFLFQSNPIPALAVFGAGIMCAGLAVFAFFGCIAATKGILLLTKNIVLGVKSLFIKKEATQ